MGGLALLPDPGGVNDQAAWTMAALGMTVTGNRGGRGQGRVSINTGGVALFTGRGKGRAANIRAALDRGWVVMFTLVPSVQPRKVLDIEGVRRSIPARLLRNISAALA
jgi:hypothetical protein